MAQYKHLPIYKATYELLEAVMRKTNANAYNERSYAAKQFCKSGCVFDDKLTKLIAIGERPCSSV